MLIVYDNVVDVGYKVKGIYSYKNAIIVVNNCPCSTFLYKINFYNNLEDICTSKHVHFMARSYTDVGYIVKCTLSKHALLMVVDTKTVYLFYQLVMSNKSG